VTSTPYVRTSQPVSTRSAQIQSNILRPTDQPKRPAFTVRLADIAALRPDGSLFVDQIKVPAMPVFDAALSAFGRGTLLQGPDCPVAIEDIQPGDQLITAQGNVSTVTWIGSASFSPAELGSRMPLTRVMADSFGVGRPDSFLTLGAAARMLKTPAHLRAGTSKTPLMTHARDFIDGTNVIDVTPPTPLRLFHLALDQHGAVMASGLEVEAFHPGLHPTRNLSHTLRIVYMAMFPHIHHLSEFGPMAYLRTSEGAEDQPVQVQHSG
jgi:hypothetical protein